MPNLPKLSAIFPKLCLVVLSLFASNAGVASTCLHKSTHPRKVSGPHRIHGTREMHGIPLAGFIAGSRSGGKEKSTFLAGAKPAGIEKSTIGALSTTANQAARKLADAIVSAYGGEKVLRDLAEAGSCSKGKLIEYSTISGAANSFDCDILSKSEKTRIEFDVMGQRMITGYNGTQCWVQQGDQVFQTNETTALRIKEEIEHGLLLLVGLNRPEYKLEYMSKRLALGKQCDVLKVIPADGKPTLFYADEISHLILQSEYRGYDAEQGTECTKRFCYEDYRSLDGSLVPYKITEYSGNTKASEIIFSTIKDADLLDKLFEEPDLIDTAIGKNETISLPFEYVSNEIIIKAKINDSKEIRLLVDSGATQSVLDRNAAKHLGEAQESHMTLTTGSGSVPLSYLIVPKFVLGNLTLKDVQFAVADLASFSQFPGDRPEGLIGANILRRFAVTIDYPQRRLILAHPNNVKISPSTFVIHTKPTLGMSGVLLEGELDGKKLSFLLDTGAAFNNISTQLASTLIRGPLLPVGDLQGLDGKKVKIGSVRFNALKIGPWTAEKPMFSIVPTANNPAGILSRGALAILGNPLFINYAMTIDYKHQRLLLDRSEYSTMMQDALAELGAIEAKYLDRTSFAAVVDYRKALQDARHKELPAVEACCLADLASAFGESSEQPKAEATLQKVTDMFKDAQKKAAQSQDKAIEAQVLAKWANYLIAHGKSIESARPIAAAAIKCCPTESTGYAAMAALSYLSKDFQLTEPLANQSLMLNPANWQALWLRYDLAQRNGAADEKLLIVEQLHRYYPENARVNACCNRLHPNTKPQRHKIVNRTNRRGALPERPRYRRRCSKNKK